MSPSPFLRLPREVRDRIYEFVFEFETVVSLSPPRRNPSIRGRSGLATSPADKHSWFGWLWSMSNTISNRETSSSYAQPPFHVGDSVGKATSILLVNQQISAEAATTLYARYTFATTPLDLVTFLRLIGRNRDLIRKIEIRDAWLLIKECYLAILALFGTLENLTNLQTVEFRTYYRDSYRDAGKLNKRLLYNGIGPLQGRIDIVVRNLACKSTRHIEPSKPAVSSYFEVETWTYAKGATEWVCRVS
ncbi:hypothetical protein MMC28_011375 [Mycoblastus sanguinarius]|nr:hypothetical protein [Mycoblastus sanguinarius]